MLCMFAFVWCDVREGGEGEAGVARPGLGTLVILVTY